MKFGKSHNVVCAINGVFCAQIMQQDEMDIEETILSQMSLPISLEEMNGESCKSYLELLFYPFS